MAVLPLAEQAAAPRISRSRHGNLKAASKLRVLFDCGKPLSATSFNILSRLYIKKAYAVRFDLPTRPRS